MRVYEEKHKDLAVAWPGGVGQAEGRDEVLVEVWECDAPIFFCDHFAYFLHAGVVPMGLWSGISVKARAEDLKCVPVDTVQVGHAIRVVLSMIARIIDGVAERQSGLR